MSDSTSYCTNNFNFKDNDLLIEIILNIYSGTSMEKYDGDENCGICWEELKDKYAIVLHCTHVFHRNCLLQNVLKYKRTNCPECQ
jgi:hypothetical protein